MLFYIAIELLDDCCASKLQHMTSVAQCRVMTLLHILYRQQRQFSIKRHMPTSI